MSHYRLTAKATADLLDIWSYIARDNCQAADDPATMPLQIIRFLHAARNIPRQLKSD